MDYTIHTEEEIDYILREIKVKSIDDLFIDIPEEYKLKKDLKLPKSLDEKEIFSLAKELSLKNKLYKIDLRGAGAYRHYRLAVIDEIVSRQEFYTAYTPYQPEISQGTLATIFEFQSFMANLTGLHLANASHYDGATALAESILMACNITKKKEVLVIDTLHPYYKSVLITYLQNKNIELRFIALDKYNFINLEYIEDRLKLKNVCCIVLQYPDFFGNIYNLKEISQLAHKYKALVVSSTTEALSLGLLKSPGSLGVDIASVEAHSLGLNLNFSGPYLGVIATLDKYMRKIPGRIVGLTKDRKGNLGYVLTLQAREQHIRREKATSNICSNQALCALTATIYLSALGKKGFEKLAYNNYVLAHYLKDKLIDTGKFELLYKDYDFFNEFSVRYYGNLDKLIKFLKKQDIYLGIKLEKFYPDLKDCILISVTELVSKQDIDNLFSLLLKEDI